MERRSFQRHQASIRATARMGRSAVPVWIHNLSVTGCMLELEYGTGKPDLVVHLVFEDGGIRVSGRTVWAQYKSLGMEFETPLHPSTVSHLERKK